MQLGVVPRRWDSVSSISGLVVEYIVAIDVTRVRFPADALLVRHLELLRDWSEQ